MASVHDVAAYILHKRGPVPAMKLQKLLYYAQAWSLVWDERPLFDARIEAWANGPVVVDAYDYHRRCFVVKEWLIGDKNKLDETALETIDAVLEYYGDKESFWLSSLTHQEDPWKNARNGLARGQRGNHEITHAAMAEYYEGLTDSTHD